jgi:hypothetical protein
MRRVALAPNLEESPVESASRRNSFAVHPIQRKTPTTLVTGVRGTFLSGQKPEVSESEQVLEFAV